MFEKDLYFVVTNGYCFVISDDGETRRVLREKAVPVLHYIKLSKDLAEAYLRDIVVDDSSWEEFEETVEELACEDYNNPDAPKILAKMRKEL